MSGSGVLWRRLRIPVLNSKLTFLTPLDIIPEYENILSIFGIIRCACPEKLLEPSRMPTPPEKRFPVNIMQALILFVTATCFILQQTKRLGGINFAQFQLLMSGSVFFLHKPEMRDILENCPGKTELFSAVNRLETELPMMKAERSVNG